MRLIDWLVSVTYWEFLRKEKNLGKSIMHHIVMYGL